jgi:hypothetical protein
MARIFVHDDFTNPEESWVTLYDPPTHVDTTSVAAKKMLAIPSPLYYN